MRIVVAMDAPQRDVIAAALAAEGVEVLAVVAAADPAHASHDAMLGAQAAALAVALDDADALVLEVSRTSLTAGLVARCDRSGVRIVPIGTSQDADAARLAAIFGLEAPHDLDLASADPATMLVDRPERSPAETAPARPRIIAVWGGAGSPGRSTLAIELAVELARGRTGVALVDADVHAPAIALALGLADDGPGFAAACRQAERGALDPRELTRISQPLGRTGVDVLTGLNRPSRWPELSQARVTAALAVCREWADVTVVDVAAPLERDEEIVSDLEGPRRNAATLAVLGAADLVVAVVGADPLGVARFLRAAPELRAASGAASVVVVANRLRPGALGLDARGQIRRAIERFGGFDDVWFVPQDPRSADAALLAGRSIAQTAPKSPLTLAIRRVVGEAIEPAPTASGLRGRDAA